MVTNPLATPPHPHEHKETEFLNLIERVSPEADPTSILLFRQVQKVHHLLTRSAEKQLEIAGLSWPKLMLLLVLQHHETEGTDSGMNPSELSELQGIPRNHVSMLLASLEEEGLVRRELHGTDRRKFLIHLTPQGRKILKAKLGTQFRQITKCFAVFDPEERATLLELLRRLAQSLSEMSD